MDEAERDAFLADVYAMVLVDRSRKALGLIFTVVDDLIYASEFDAVADVLASVDLDRLDPQAMLGFAAITYAAREHLGESRVRFLSRVESELRIQEPERVGALLAGLR